MPTQRLSESEISSQKIILELIDSGDSMQAYNEIVETRTIMPELTHPDIRFDQLFRIWQSIGDDNPTDYFRDIVAADMMGDTVQGGEGSCDNHERLRRYNILGTIDKKFN